MNVTPNASFAHAERSTGNTYAEWVRLQSASYCEDGREHLLATFPENSRAIAPLISKNVKDLTWRVATDVWLQTNNLRFASAGFRKDAL